MQENGLYVPSAIQIHQILLFSHAFFPAIHKAKPTLNIVMSPGIPITATPATLVTQQDKAEES